MFTAMNAFVFPVSVLYLYSVYFVYGAPSLEGANQLNYPPTAMLPLVSQYPSYEEFVESNVGPDPVSSLPDPRLSNNMILASGGEFGEEGCAHLKGMPCDGKMDTMIEKTYWMLYMASTTKDQIDLDTIACVDRCVQDSCTAVKSRITFFDTGSYLQEIWGTDGKCLIYLKQTIVLESQKLYIFRSEVKDIQKGFINDQKNLSAVTKKDALTKILQCSSFVILGANFEQFIIFRSCSKSNPVVFVYVKEEAYLQSDDQKKQMLHDIDVILYNNKIDNRKLKFFKDKFPDSTHMAGPGVDNYVGLGTGLNNIL